MCTTSPSVPASPHNSREVKRTEYRGSVTEPPPCASISSISAALVDPRDGPVLALGVARGAGVAGGMPLAHPHCVADRESRGGPGDEVGRQYTAIGPGQRKMPACAAIEFLWRGQARFDSERRDAGQPVFVVRRRQVMRGIHPLDRMPELAAGSTERSDRPDHHAKGAPLPVLGEHRLAVGVLDRAETVQTAKIMYAVHVGIIRISGPTPIHFPQSGDNRFNRSGGWLADIHLLATRDIVISSPKTTGRRTEKSTSTRRYKCPPPSPAASPATSRSRSCRPASSAVPPSAWPAWPTPQPSPPRPARVRPSWPRQTPIAKPAPNAIPGWRHHHGVDRFDMFNQ